MSLEDDIVTVAVWMSDLPLAQHSGAGWQAWQRVRLAAERTAKLEAVSQAEAKIVAVHDALFDLWYLRRDPIAEGKEPEPHWDYVFRLCIDTISKVIGAHYGEPPAWPPTGDDLA